MMENDNIPDLAKELESMSFLYGDHEVIKLDKPFKVVKLDDAKEILNKALTDQLEPSFKKLTETMKDLERVASSLNFKI